MVNIFDLLPIVVIWAATLWHAPKLTGPPWQRCMPIGLLALALCLTVRLDAVSDWIAATSDMPNLAVLLKHSLAVVVAGAWLEWALRLRAVDAPTRRTLRTMRILQGTTLACLTFTYLHVPDSANAEFFAGQGHDPAAARHELVFTLYLAATGLCAAWVFWRKSRLARDPATRWATRLLAAAFALTPGYGLGRLIALTVYATGHTAPDAFTTNRLSQPFGALSVLLIVAGVSVPGLVTLHRTWIAHRRLRTLRPLWDLVVPAIPDAVLPPPPRSRTDLLGLGSTHLRLVRQVVEIRDGMLALRRYADPDLCERLRVDLEARGLVDADLELATVAAWTILTADALHRGKTPQRVVAPPPRPPKPSLDAEAKRLTDIEDALHWPRTKACVEAILGASENGAVRRPPGRENASPLP
ncbi:MAB_1171c family putative transporter [Embleya sp. NPDC059259]|uniref:MAB_1171c family putative transporter n=1 Tax=unclassified Embleya TaxID=2699296 RepID=UPI0036AFBE24